MVGVALSPVALSHSTGSIFDVDIPADGSVTYIIPRPWPNASGFTTILGGKYQEGNWDTSFSAVDARGIFDRCAALAPAIQDKDTKILKHNVGLRPARKGGPRVEAEWMDIPCGIEWITAEGSAVVPTTGKVLVVHAYGFGCVATYCMRRMWR